MKFKHTFFYLAITTAICLLSFVPVKANVKIDFAQQQTELSSMSGILHGMSLTQPPDSTIKALAPKLWRMGKPDLYERVTGFDAQFQLVLSDTWGYPNKSYGWPYENYQRWESHVRKLAQENKNKEMMWDVWNEPNLKKPFWQGTKEQLFETYKRAYKVLREELGSEVAIGGLSLTHYDRDYITAFLEYCKANKLEVNFLSWHELNDNEIASIDDRLIDARNSLQKNPAYRTLKIKKIYVNEVVGSSAQYRPGEIIAYLYYLEKGKADGAVKSCWDTLAKDKVNNCSNNTLDGMLALNTFKPRAAWWAYKVYADGFRSRVQSQSDNPLVVALGSRSNPDGKAQVILGYFGQKHSPPTTNVTVTLKNLQKLGFTRKGQHLHLKLEKIPNTNEQVVQKLLSVKEENISVINGSVKIVIPNFGIHEAYLVTINKPAL